MPSVIGSAPLFGEILAKSVAPTIRTGCDGGGGESKRVLSFRFALAGQLPTQSKHISGVPCAESSWPRTGKQAKAVPDTQKERHSHKEASRPCLKPSTQGHTARQGPCLISGGHTSPLLSGTYSDTGTFRTVPRMSVCPGASLP